ncbi:hypothetical protein N8508_00805 [bacterium]|nr:hypothetical protein [bacterium]
MPIFPKPIDLAADYVWTGDHTFDGVVTCNGDFNAIDGDFSGSVNIGGNLTKASTLFTLINGTIVTGHTSSSLKLYRDIIPNANDDTSNGSSSRRWSGVYSIDGSFTGNLTSEVGGSYKLYNLGTEGDTDTEYLDMSWDTNTASITTQETGAGVGRSLVVGAGGTYLSCAYSSTLNLYYNSSRVFRAEASATYMYYGGAKLLKLTAGVVGTDVTNTVSLGTDAVRWSDVYSVDGDFSGNITAENLPTSDPGVPGQFYVTTGGALKVSQ